MIQPSSINIKVIWDLGKLLDKVSWNFRHIFTISKSKKREHGTNSIGIRDLVNSLLANIIKVASYMDRD